MSLSNFKETKQALETIFLDNWNDTPIHYGDSEFNSEEISKWINVVYQPMSGYVMGISGSSVNSRGSLHVVCWAKNDFDASVLADSVVTIFLDNIPSGIQTTGYEINDQGHSANDQAFLMLTFPVKSFIGSC